MLNSSMSSLLGPSLCTLPSPPLLCLAAWRPTLEGPMSCQLGWILCLLLSLPLAASVPRLKSPLIFPLAPSRFPFVILAVRIFYVYHDCFSCFCASFFHPSFLLPSSLPLPFPLSVCSFKPAHASFTLVHAPFTPVRPCSHTVHTRSHPFT